MTQIEGSGKKPPAPLSVKLTDGSLLQLLREAKKRSEYRAYSARPDQWGQGLTGGTVIPNVGTIDEQTLPILTGMVGEYIVCHLLNRRTGVDAKVDFENRSGGDGGKDIVANGLRIDVKTRRKKDGRLDTFLVRHATEYGRQVPLLADAYVFAEWNRGHVVDLHGYATRDDVEASQIAPARRGNHTNYEIQPADLRPMSRLFDEIRSREWR